jgi:hypothetical protein
VFRIGKPDKGMWSIRPKCKSIPSLLGRSTTLLLVIGSGDAKEWDRKGCIAFLDEKWLPWGLWREGDAATDTSISKAVSKTFSWRDNGCKPREGWPDSAADHRGVSAVGMSQYSNTLRIHPPFEHYMVCIPFNGAIDGK